MKKINIRIDNSSSVLKFNQLIESIIDLISRDEIRQGEMLPSVNQIMAECKLSRDTVFKAFNELKRRGIVESVPNRGYFVSKNITKVFLFLDTFKAYKEVLYMSFLKHLPSNVSVDLHFHHYNPVIFEKIISESIGRYSKYIIMNFDHPVVPEIIGRIPPEQLLVIDWKIYSAPGGNVVYQDFGQPVYDCFEQNSDKIRRYNDFVLYYPPFTYHPKDTIDFFRKFCKDFHIHHSVVFEPEKFVVRKGTLYFLVSDRTLAQYLDQCAAKGFEPGRETGVISYNETPMKKYVNNGITVISTDFELLGQKAAEFVTGNCPIQFTSPTTLKVRASL